MYSKAAGWLVVSVLGVALLIGCGSSSTPTSGGTTPTTPGTPGTPAPNGSTTAPDAYQAGIENTIGKNITSMGQITVDTSANNGAGTLQVQVGTSQSTTFILQFCPYPQAFNGCLNVQSFNGSGMVMTSVNFQFPAKGTFAGEFQIMANGAQQFVGDLGLSGSHAALLPARGVTGGIGQTTGSAPGSGTVTVNNQTAHVTLSATTANHTFTVAICGLFPSTPCSVLGTVMTDAQGNGSADFTGVAGVPVIRVSDTEGAEFVSGFRVE